MCSCNTSIIKAKKLLLVASYFGSINGVLDESSKIIVFFLREFILKCLSSTYYLKRWHWNFFTYCSVLIEMWKLVISVRVSIYSYIFCEKNSKYVKLTNHRG